MVTQKLLKEMFGYRDDGNLYWICNMSGSARFGDIAGYFDKTKGYITVSVKSKNYRLHRMIFLWHEGYLPEFIDHDDGNPLNNRIGNLQPITRSQNAMKSKNFKNNTSGFRGVYWDKRKRRWEVMLNANGIRHKLGRFKDKNDAIKARIAGEDKYFGEFIPVDRKGA